MKLAEHGAVAVTDRSPKSGNTKADLLAKA